mmetsp:Transcript_3274/g.12485  ORF Transcript_3274/g.12485 Transcript_3274/m.12485 type:complete len:432 (-) Transcript_3274:150-1445(-)
MHPPSHRTMHPFVALHINTTTLLHSHLNIMSRDPQLGENLVFGGTRTSTYTGRNEYHNFEHVQSPRQVSQQVSNDELTCHWEILQSHQNKFFDLLRSQLKSTQQASERMHAQSKEIKTVNERVHTLTSDYDRLIDDFHNFKTTTKREQEEHLKELRSLSEQIAVFDKNLGNVTNQTNHLEQRVGTVERVCTALQEWKVKFVLKINEKFEAPLEFLNNETQVIGKTIFSIMQWMRWMIMPRFMSRRSNVQNKKKVVRLIFSCGDCLSQEGHTTGVEHALRNLLDVDTRTQAVQYAKDVNLDCKTVIAPVSMGDSRNISQGAFIKDLYARCRSTGVKLIVLVFVGKKKSVDTSQIDGDFHAIVSHAIFHPQEINSNLNTVKEYVHEHETVESRRLGIETEMEPEYAFEQEAQEYYEKWDGASRKRTISTMHET